MNDLLNKIEQSTHFGVWIAHADTKQEWVKRNKEKKEHYKYQTKYY